MNTRITTVIIICVVINLTIVIGPSSISHFLIRHELSATSTRPRVSPRLVQAKAARQDDDGGGGDHGGGGGFDVAVSLSGGEVG